MGREGKKKYVIANVAWQSPRVHIEREEIASSFLLAMTQGLLFSPYSFHGECKIQSQKFLR